MDFPKVYMKRSVDAGEGGGASVGVGDFVQFKDAAVGGVRDVDSVAQAAYAFLVKQDGIDSDKALDILNKVARIRSLPNSDTGSEVGAAIAGAQAQLGGLAGTGSAAARMQPSARTRLEIDLSGECCTYTAEIDQAIVSGKLSGKFIP